jgi:tetratricopeptide (TPR) repeat protein
MRLRNSPRIATKMRVIFSMAAWALILLAPGCSIMQPLKAGHPDFDKFSSTEHSDFGVVYENAGDLRSARRQFEYAVRKDAGNYVAWTNLGNIHAHLRHWDRARDAYLHALALHPGYGPAVINLAHTYTEASPPAPRIATAVLDAQIPLLNPEFKQAAEEIREEVQREPK